MIKDKEGKDGDAEKIDQPDDAIVNVQNNMTQMGGETVHRIDV